MMNFDPLILLIKKPEKQLYVDLIKSCESNEILIKFLEEIKEKSLEELYNNFDLIIDTLFGFSFKGPIKSPYDQIISALKNNEGKVFSVDIPSGWDVEKGA